MTTTRQRVAKPDWTNLFDMGEVDSACEAVADAIEQLARGEGNAAMHSTLRALLIAEVDAYLHAHFKPGVLQSNVEAAWRLRHIAVKLADLIERRFPFEPGSGKRWANDLRAEWMEFIAHAAGYLIYSGQRQRKAAAKLSRGRARALPPRVVIEFLKKGGHPILTTELAKTLAGKYRVGVRTVWRRWKEAKKTLSLP